MNTEDHDNLPDTMRWQLRGLRKDVAPSRDLWEGIAGRIASEPRPATTPLPLPARRHRSLAAFAVAATLALAVGLGWQLRPASDPVPVPEQATPATTFLAAEAETMAREYEDAVRKIEAARGFAETPAALAELDASAAVIRQALASSPDSRFLFDRLQRVYAQRLSLTQRLPIA